MNLLELLKRSGISKETLFCDIVKQWGFTLSLYKIQFQKQIERAPLKDRYLTAKIQEFNLFFLEGKATGMFAKMGEVADLLRIGFHLQIGNPETRIYDLINNPEFKNARFNLAASIRNAKYLSDVSSSYQGLRMCELKDEDEKTFEAISYVVEGGNFAMLLAFLEDYKANKKPPVEQAGLSNDTNSKTYFLLKAYFEKRCKDLVEYDIQKISEQSGLAARALVNKNKDLKKINYGLNHTGNHNQIKSLYSTYQKLLNEFEGVNETAFNEVQTRLNRITKTYGDLLSQN